MRLLTAIALMPALALSNDIGSHELDWLVGCWATPDRTAQEVWVVDSDRTLAGFSVAVENDRVTFYEILSITPGDDGTFVYTAHPAGQNSASFIATTVTKNSVLFSNPDHDYPQEIRYERLGHRLNASISLLGGSNARSFDKIACAQMPTAKKTSLPSE